ncbi:transposase [Pseudomonas sp. CGJS7]|uniref:transposase n=1 Tax=Pseudomonas sp. CGJS7 TaxID=3109348 RepID=UPI0030092E76
MGIEQEDGVIVALHFRPQAKAEVMDVPSRGLISDQQWRAIVDMLPDRLGVRARNRGQQYRDFVESVLWVVAGDALWNELPRSHGSWRAVYVRFLRWNNINAWDGVAEILGHDQAVTRALLARAAQHTAIVRKRMNRKLLHRMLEV